ncbi:hypothetical protein C5Y96_26730 [Blastopirellula marina]|uniref:Uncharacterized protein n=1 Tax=Blastopirellula marina TaxID=124 RepID=A0A2S8EYV2_9BACT|nr:MULTISPECIES: hypothetical protein [Pirellulaceae]PQO25100.1 hypothetical protein C5Y96_26730 [Blastopirellula marina]RCS40951.1 hypothetical protein DTL36_26775 [Bremerella cremea]
MDEFENQPSRKSSWFRFSLRSLLLLMLLVAVYLAGRYGNRHVFPSQLSGAWEATLPSGFVRTVTLIHLEENRFLLKSGGSVFNGVYQWQSDRLVVIQPDDKRMKGLIWKWDDGNMTLIGEPPGNPTGSSYLGAKMERLEKTEDEK